ncbi:MAG: FAD-binding protein [candidate division WOR-3 bacterium]
MNRSIYDVIIIGSGPAGIFAALELAPIGFNVLILEKGKDLEQRKCPALEKQIPCVRCKECSITSGFGGAGAFSDGKVTLSPEVGGNLKDFLNEEELNGLFSHVERVLKDFGAPNRVFGTEVEKIDKLVYEAQKYGLQVVRSRVLHMGTDKGYQVLKNLRDALREKGVEIKNGEPVNDLIIENGKIKGVKTEKDIYKSRFVIMAPGRSGAEWAFNMCNKYGMVTETNPVDIGVRLEVPAEILKNLTDILYEPKIVYYSKSFDDKVRTFCVNPYGVVVPEMTEEVVTVNGHSFTYSASDNTNLAILVSTKFTEPFKDPVSYGKSIARLANLLTGSVIIQRYRDLKLGRRSTEERIRRSLVRPTYKGAVPGDLSFALPYRYLSSIMEMLDQLDKLAPGIADDGNLIYGVEVKFYSSKIKVTREFEVETIQNLFAIGDGAGITRGLSQAIISGILAAQAIIKRN